MLKFILIENGHKILSSENLHEVAHEMLSIIKNYLMFSKSNGLMTLPANQNKRVNNVYISVVEKNSSHRARYPLEHEKYYFSLETMKLETDSGTVKDLTDFSNAHSSLFIRLIQSIKTILGQSVNSTSNMNSITIGQPFVPMASKIIQSRAPATSLPRATSSISSIVSNSEKLLNDNKDHYFVNFSIAGAFPF